MTLKLTQHWKPTQAEFDAFAKLSGDDNPVHVDAEFSAATRFGRTVSHGMLIYTKLWALLATHKPDANFKGQNLMFPNPCYTGEDIELSITETGLNVFELRAMRISDRAIVLQGEGELT